MWGQPRAWWGDSERVAIQGSGLVMVLFLWHFWVSSAVCCFFFKRKREKTAVGGRAVGTPRGSSQPGDSSGPSGMWSLVPCQHQLGSAGSPAPVAGPAAGRTHGMALSARAAMSSPLSFLSLRPGGQKPHFFLLHLRPAPEEVLLTAMHCSAALRPHPSMSPSRRGPTPARPHLGVSPSLLSPRFPLCWKPLTHRSRGRGRAAPLRRNPRRVAGAAAASPAHRRFCSPPWQQESATSPPALTTF